MRRCRSAGAGRAVRGAALVAAVLLSVLAATGLAASRLYLDVPPPGHTGGFDERDCTECHFDNPVGVEGGEVRVSGFPAEYEAGRTYTVVVELRRGAMQRGGFQAAVRQAAGEGAGRQAGEVRALDGRVAVTEADSVTYLHHTVAGAEADGGVARWTWEWTAPLRADGRVVLHAAANAANGDDSEFGDYIYLAELVSRARR